MIVGYVRFVLFASAFEVVGWMIDWVLWRVADTLGFVNYVSRLSEQPQRLWVHLSCG